MIEERCLTIGRLPRSKYGIKAVYAESGELFLYAYNLKIKQSIRIMSEVPINCEDSLYNMKITNDAYIMRFGNKMFIMNKKTGLIYERSFNSNRFGYCRVIVQGYLLL
jgi:hypothetical protein